MFRKLLPWLIGLFVAFWLVFFIILINKPNQKALIDAEIPQETKDFFTKLIGKMDFNIHFVDFLDDDLWSNDNDLKLDSSCFTDETKDGNFIVYYDTTDRKEKNKAIQTLENANEAIKPLASLFGKYYFTEDVKGRKLPIYLAKNDEMFQSVYEKLSRSKNNTRWMAGVCINSISDKGEVFTNGIIIKDFGAGNNPETFKGVLRHEMAHYVHFNSINWLKTYPLTWETEGFAKYFEDDKEYLNYSNVKDDIHEKLSKIELENDVKDYMDAYWVGYSVMLFMEDEYGKKKTMDYIHNNYSEKAPMNMKSTFSINIDDFDDAWTQYVKQNY